MNILSGFGKREFVGIDFSSSSVKLAYVRKAFDKAEVVSLVSRDITGLSDEDISKIIRNAFNSLGVKNPHVVNMVSSSSVITKNIEIPSVDHREIKEIISLQAGRHTPYSREEIIIDHTDIGTYQNNYTKVLLVIVPRNLVKRQFEILDKAGLRLQRVVLTPESFGWLTHRQLKIESEKFPVSVVHIDEDSTDFTVIYKNKVVFIRSIQVGTRYLINEKERYVPKFVEELKKSLEAYQTENIEKTPNRFILTGAIEELKDLEDALNSTMHLSIQRVNYFDNLMISKDALKAASQAKRISFLSVISGLLASEELKIDLVPHEVKLRKSVEERGRDLIKTGILVLTGLALVFFIFITKIYFKSTYLKKLEHKYETIDKDAQKLKKDFMRVRFVRNYLSNRNYPLEILTELYNVSLPDLEVSDIKFDGQGKFSVKGTAESMSTVFSFVENMEKSKYFKDVKTKYTSKRKDGLKDVTDFEVTALLGN